MMYCRQYITLVKPMAEKHRLKLVDLILKKSPKCGDNSEVKTCYTFNYTGDNFKRINWLPFNFFKL